MDARPLEDWTLLRTKREIADFMGMSESQLYKKHLEKMLKCGAIQRKPRKLHQWTYEGYVKPIATYKAESSILQYEEEQKRKKRKTRK